MVRDLPIHHGLPGQSRSEVALHPGHDADPAHHVVIDLAPAAVHVVVHGGKIMLHVDPLGHHLRGGHDDLQQPAARILKVVIRVKKRAPLQIERLGDVSPGNDEGRVPRQAPLRPGLAPVGAAPADMRHGLPWQ